MSDSEDDVSWGSSTADSSASGSGSDSSDSGAAAARRVAASKAAASKSKAPPAVAGSAKPSSPKATPAKGSTANKKKPVDSDSDDDRNYHKKPVLDDKLPLALDDISEASGSDELDGTYAANHKPYERDLEGHKLQGLFHTHDALVRDLDALLAALTAVDDKAANLVLLRDWLEFWTFFKTSLHDHHTSEDMYFFPAYLKQVPALKRFVMLAKDEHEDIEERLHVFDADVQHLVTAVRKANPDNKVLPPPPKEVVTGGEAINTYSKKKAEELAATNSGSRVKSTGSRIDKSPFLITFADRLNAALKSGQDFYRVIREHLWMEERFCVPAIKAGTTEEFQRKLGKTHGKSRPTGELVWMLAAGGDEAEADFLKALPMPPRLLYQKKWKKAFFTETAPRLYLLAHGYEMPPKRADDGDAALRERLATLQATRRDAIAAFVTGNGTLLSPKGSSVSATSSTSGAAVVGTSSSGSKVVTISSSGSKVDKKGSKVDKSSRVEKTDSASGSAPSTPKGTTNSAPGSAPSTPKGNSSSSKTSSKLGKTESSSSTGSSKVDKTDSSGSAKLGKSESSSSTSSSKVEKTESGGGGSSKLGKSESSSSTSSSKVGKSDSDGSKLHKSSSKSSKSGSKVDHHSSVSKTSSSGSSTKKE